MSKPPGARHPQREEAFCALWNISYAELAQIETEDGFVEAVAEYMGYWLTQRHTVYAAILKRATDPTNPKMMDDAKEYLRMTEPRRRLGPYDQNAPKGVMRRKDGSFISALADDDQVVDLTP